MTIANYSYVSNVTVVIFLLLHIYRGKLHITKTVTENNPLFDFVNIEVKLCATSHIVMRA